MAFTESRLLECPGFGYTGGPGFSTDVITVRSGVESRNANWNKARHRFELGMMPRPKSQFLLIKEAFMICRGRWMGFRLKDYQDFETALSNGVLIPISGGLLVESGAGLGYSVPTYQLGKLYELGALDHVRLITKPVSGEVAIERDGSPVSPTIDYATGIVTFAADQSESVTSHTPGADHVFVVSSAFSPNVSIGERVYLSGVTGTAADVLNGISHEVTNVAADTITIATSTVGLTASGGTAALYAQADETLQWSGEFDVPVRFDIDQFDAVIINRQGSEGELLIELPSVPLIETRDIA